MMNRREPIIQAPKFEKGEKGDKGDSGPQGLAGRDGRDGKDGVGLTPKQQAIVQKVVDRESRKGLSTIEKVVIIAGTAIGATALGAALASIH